MSRTFLVFLVIVAVLSTVLGDQSPNKKCAKNEEWTNCGSLCPPKCNGKPQVCPTLCVAGCQCIKGYLRNKNNKCVRPCDC